MSFRILAIATNLAINAILCSTERPEDDSLLSLFQSQLEFKPRSNLAEEGEAAILQAHEDMHKAELYSREASKLLELRDVDKQLDANLKEETAKSHRAPQDGDAEQPEAPPEPEKEAALDAALASIVNVTEADAETGKRQGIAHEAKLPEIAKGDNHLVEEGEAAIVKAHEDMHKAQLYSREASVLLELRDVDKQLEANSKEEDSTDRSAQDVDAEQPEAAPEPEKEAALDAALASVVDAARAKVETGEPKDNAQESTFPEIANGEIQETIKHIATLA